MSFVQGATNAFKLGLADGAFNFNTGTTDVYKIALYTPNASLDQNTATYTTVGETTGTGYTAGGQTLTITQVPTTGGQTTSPGTVYWSFANVSWSGAISAAGALIYKDSGGGNTTTVCVLDFGSQKISTTTFTVQFPAVTNSTSILRST